MNDHLRNSQRAQQEIFDYDVRPPGFFVSDHANIAISAIEKYGAHIDYKRLLCSLERSYAWVRKPLICAVRHPGQDLRRFEHYLRCQRAEVVIEDVVYTNGKGKADFDSLIGFYCGEVAPICDWIVIASGDGDFVKVVRRLQHHGVKIELIAFECCCSRALRAAVDKFTEIGEEFLFNKPRKKGE